MWTDTKRRLGPYVATVAPLALAIVLPPKYMAAYLLVLGALGLAWGIFNRRDLLLRPSVLAIAVPLALAGFFCLLGTLPVTQQSNIQLEFLKYAIYAAAFLLGLLALGEDWKRGAFVVTVIVTACVFFVATALTSGSNFGIDQSWPLYPPDQNNTSSILAPFAVFTLAFRPRWLKVGILLLLFLFFTFAESRLGVIMLLAVAAFDIFRDWRSGLAVLLMAGLISALFSLSDVGVQTTVMRSITQVTQAPAFQPGAESVEEPSGASQSTPTGPVGEPAETPRISTNRIIEFGTQSDASRIKIYQRALDISIAVFPNLVGLGDAEVTRLLNTPPLDGINTFQHAHNVLLQGYLAYGLPGTLCLLIAAIGIMVFAVRRRAWQLAGAVAMTGAYGMTEALISDLRVVAVLMMLMGSSMAVALVPNKEHQSK